MNKERIEVGDIVRVYFIRADTIQGARVDYIPGDTGDSWILWDRFWERTVYVQLFERMDLIQKGTTP